MVGRENRRNHLSIVYLIAEVLQKVILYSLCSYLRHNLQIKLVDCQPLDQQTGEKIIRVTKLKVTKW